MNQTYPPKLSNETRAQRVAFIQAQWHSDIVGQARDAFLAECESQGLEASQVEIFTVAGAYEIPLQAKLLAKSGRYGAIVAAGFVVDGGIYRHEFVAQAVIEGLMQVQLETEVPVMSVVLTPHHFQPKGDHELFFAAHFVGKGREAADAVAQIASLGV